MEDEEISLDPEAISNNKVAGSVGDGPVVGAAMRVLGSNGDLLAELQSDGSAGYSIDVRTKGKYYPLVIDAQNGIDIVTNQAPDFVLVGAVSEPGKKSVANINPFSTIAIELARELPGGLKKESIATAERYVVETLSSGLSTLAATGPLTTRIDGSNVAEIVKASETLGEIIRRVRDLQQSHNRPASGDSVVRAIASDLVDGVIDGRGGRNVNARVAALTTVVSVQVLLEAMQNELHVYGQDATGALDAAVRQVAGSRVDPALADLTVTTAMVDAVNVGLGAMLAVSPSPKLMELAAAASSVQSDMDSVMIQTLIPADYRATLEEASMTIAGSSTDSINTINEVSRTGDISGIDTSPDPAPDPEPDPAPDPEPDPAPDPEPDPVPDPAPDPVPDPAPDPVNNAPTISGRPAAEVSVNSTYSFRPTASDVDGDTLTFSITNRPAWASFSTSTGRLSGTPGDADVDVYDNIRISVSDGTDTASLPVFSITVSPVSLGSVTLSWTAPTQNEDGSPLTDLAGFRFYWGTTPGVYTDSVTLDNPGLTRYVVENLVPGTYEFVATSYNRSGVESRYSSPATRTAQ